MHNVYRRVICQNITRYPHVKRIILRMTYLFFIIYEISPECSISLHFRIRVEYVIIKCPNKHTFGCYS